MLKRLPRAGSRKDVAPRHAVPPPAAVVKPELPPQPAAPRSSDPEILFRAGRQAWKVRLLTWLSLACAAGAMVAAQDLLLTYGTRPADGGVLAPLAVRIAWSGTVATLGLGFAFGMWLYGCYAIREIWWLPAEHRLRIVTYRFVGSRTETVDAAEIAGATARRERFCPGGV